MPVAGRAVFLLGFLAHRLVHKVVTQHRFVVLEVLREEPPGEGEQTLVIGAPAHANLRRLGRPILEKIMHVENHVELARRSHVYDVVENTEVRGIQLLRQTRWAEAGHQASPLEGDPYDVEAQSLEPVEVLRSRPEEVHPFHTGVG